MLRHLVLASLISLTAACCASSTAPTAPAPGPTEPAGPTTPTEPTEPTGPTGPAEPAFDVSRLGAPCGEGGAGGGCVAPTTCVEFYGIAGPKGPKFSSCEVTCADKGAACPAGSQCVTIADGPGAVCRPVQPSTEPPPVVNQ